MVRNLPGGYYPGRGLPSDTAIEGIVFDLGNVLQPYDPWRAVDNLTAVSGRSRWLIALYFRLSGRWKQFDAGCYSTEAFCQRVIGDLRLPISNEQFVRAFADMFTVNHQLVTLLPLLARRYRLILLSDNNPIHSAWCFEQHDFYTVFEHKVLSFELGACKPSALLYQRVVDLTGIQPSRLVFIDDRRKNVRGARQAGWAAMHFHDEQSFIRQMQSQGWLDGVGDAAYSRTAS